MTTLQQQVIEGVYPASQAGNVLELSSLLAHELALSGYSLSQDDVLNVILAECRYYAGWAMFEAQKHSVVQIDGTLILDAYEWSILEPAIRSHCDVVQATRVEAVKSLGTEGFGLSVSEAKQNHLQDRNEMPKTAFVEPPFSIDLD